MIGAWWGGLSETQKEIFVFGGLLGVFVMGLAVGIFGANNFVLWEPLVYLGFGTAAASFLGSAFYFMAQIA